MKKIFLKGMLIIGLLTGFKELSHAQRVFVKVQPVAPVVVRPAAPSAQHLWIEGEWVWSTNTYVWKPGYRIIPRPHEAWVTGHWRRAYGGWNWVPAIGEGYKD